MNKIRIIICDDMPQICRHFEKVISSCDDMEVIAVASDGKEVTRLAAELIPDIILMDIQLETEEAGITATDRILSENPEIKIIMITVHKEDDLIFKSYGAGAVDYILKTETDEEIINSIRNVYNNEVFIRSSIAKKMLTEFSKMRKSQASIMYTIAIITNLTNAEFDILKLIYHGVKRKDIADMRNVEIVTINTQVRNILKKLGYRNTNEMITRLKSLGIDKILEI